MKRGLAAGLALLAMGLLLSQVSCSRVVHERELFVPRREVAHPPPAGATAISLRVGDETLQGWTVHAKDGVADLVYCQGNSETLAQTLPRLRWLADTFRVDVHALDYRGFGASDGQPRLHRCAEDVVLLHDRVRAGQGAHPRPILAYGRSIGGGMATFLAANRPLAGVVLEAPPPSAPAVIVAWNRRLPWYLRWAVRLRPSPEVEAVPDRPLHIIATVKAPLLIIHGERDTTIPLDLGRQLYDAATTPDKRWVPVAGVGHNDLRLDRPPVLDELHGLVQRSLAGWKAP